MQNTDDTPSISSGEYTDAITVIVPVNTGTVYQTEDGNDSYPTTGNEICSICICVCERLTANVPCGHTFCMECISHWLWDRRTCPLCRQPVMMTRFLIEKPNGDRVWRVREYRRNPRSYPYVIQTTNELMIETFNEEDVYLFSPQFFRGKLHFRLMIIMENAHVIMSMPPLGSFLVTCQHLRQTIEELRSRNIPLFNGARHMEGPKRHAPAITVHPTHAFQPNSSRFL